MRPEREGCLVTCDALVGETLKDLLQCRLCDTVFLDAETALFVLQSPEEPPNGLLLLGHTQFEELTTLFQDLDLLEAPGQVDQYSEAVCLCFQELQ